MSIVSIICRIIAIVGIVLGVACLFWRSAKIRRLQTPSTVDGERSHGLVAAFTPAMLLGRGIGFLAGGVVVGILTLVGVVK